MSMDPRQDRATDTGRSAAANDAQAVTNQFVLEAALLASSLAGISMRDEKHKIVQQVETAFASYAQLLRRRESLRLSAEDEAVLQQILQQIRSRLNYLKVWRLQHAQRGNEGGV